MGESRLDGNAAAGVLQEIFRLEVTAASTTCASCGAVEPLGALYVYMDAPGVVIRCRHCDEIVVRLVAAEDRYWLDARGASCLELRSPA